MCSSRSSSPTAGASNCHSKLRSKVSGESQAANSAKIQIPGAAHRAGTGKGLGRIPGFIPGAAAPADTRMWHWDEVTVALDSRLPNWEGVGVSGHREQCPQSPQKGHGQGGLQPQEGPAQPRSLQCPFQNPWELNRDHLLTGLPWHPQQPWHPQDCQSCHICPHQPLEPAFGSFPEPPNPLGPPRLL